MPVIIVKFVASVKPELERRAQASDRAIGHVAGPGQAFSSVRTEGPVLQLFAGCHPSAGRPGPNPSATTSPAEEDREMIGDLFDSPWKILIVAVVLIVLFGSKKLPDAARSLGRSMRILKAEVGSLHEEEHGAGAEVAQITAASGAGGRQSQIDALQQKR
jgi:sec-independent protein translocase protein TatA